MIKWIIALRVCLVLGGGMILLAGCSSAPGSTPGSAREKKVPKTYTVEIVNMAFQPAELAVNKGDTVLFINKDMVVHNVTEDGDKGWSSSSLEMGQSYRLVVREAVGYYCSIHTVMKGRITIP